MTDYATLEALNARAGTLGEALSILHWDQQAMMPAGGNESRGEQTALLETMIHEIAAGPAMGEAIEAASAQNDLDPWQRANAHFHIEEDDMTAGGKGAFWVIGGSFKDTSFREWAGVPERHGPFETYAEAEAKWQERAWATVDDATAQYRIESIQPADSDDGSPAPERLAYRFLTGPDTREFCEKISAALADGYVLYGDPTMIVQDGKAVCGQAVILPAQAKNTE